MFKNLLALLLLSAIVLNQNYCKATKKESLSFKDIWQKVVDWHPQIRLNHQQLQASDGELLQARLKPNPELEFEIEEFGGKGGRSGFDDATMLLAFSQEIERGGKRGKRTQVAQAQKRLQSIFNLQAKNKLFYTVRESYLEAVFSNQKLQLEQKLYEMAREYEMAMLTMVKYGKVSPLGLERARIDRALAKTDLNEAEIESAKATNALLTLFGESGEHHQIDLDEGEIDTLMTEEQSITDFDKSLISMGLEENLVLQQSRLELEKANAKTNFNVGVGLQKFTSNEETAFLLSFSTPIRRNDRNQGNILVQRAKLRIEEENRQLSLLNLRTRVFDLQKHSESLKQKLTRFKTIIVPTSSGLYTRTLKAQKAGKASYIEVLESRKTLVENERAMLSTKKELCKKLNELQQVLLIPRQDLQ